MDFIKRNKLVVAQTPGAFSPRPTIRTDENKIVISYGDLNELKQEMIQSLLLEPNEEMRIVLESDIENRFKKWYESKNMKRNYKDYLISSDIKVSKDVHLNESNV